MPILVRVEVAFSAGHRLLGYSGKCISPHGHNYRAELGIVGSDVDDNGMVIDFSLAKAALRGWIAESWDHAFLVNDQDTELVSALKSVEGSRLFYFRDANPTVENMCIYLFEEMCQLISGEVAYARIWETEHQFAQYTRNAHILAGGNLEE